MTATSSTRDGSRDAGCSSCVLPAVEAGAVGMLLRIRSVARLYGVIIRCALNYAIGKPRRIILPIHAAFCCTIPVVKQWRPPETGLTDHAELRGEYLLLRRPQFQLRGNDLYWLGSTQPRRRLSAAEAGLWGLMKRPVTLHEVRRTCGEGADAMIHEFLRSEDCLLLEPEFPADRRRVLVIEPHADDAALSIGGTMWIRRHECEFLVATMASRSNHTRYRDLGFDFFDISEVTEMRRLESELFATLVGGTHVALGLTDAELRYRDAKWTAEFFRQHRMSIRVSASRVADDQERRLWTEAVKKLLTDHQSAEVWFPLGGPHTDHLLTADACFAAFLANPSLVSGRILRVYGEFPYAARYPRQMMDALNALTNSGTVLEGTPAPISGVGEQKRHLAYVYDSQEIEEMRRDTEASAFTHGSSANQAEALWTVKVLPRMSDPSGILSASTTRPEQVEAAAAWASRNRNATGLRVLLLMPTGQWASDVALLCAAFPHARLDVIVAATAVAEVASSASDRVDVRMIASGALAWILLSLRISFAMKAQPTLFYAGERRPGQARFLSKLWPGSDTLIVESMNSLMRALRDPH
jgi:LmbE family N-acetylglucosaminyl deacetylase